MISIGQLADAKTRGDVSVRQKPPWPGDAIEVAAHLEWYRNGRQGKHPKLCRLCGRGNLPTRRHSWHPRCAAVIQPAIFPSQAIRWTLRRQRGVCAGCPEVLSVWKPPSDFELERTPGHGGHWDPDGRMVEVDHRVPLWRVALMPAGRQTLRWWLPGNLQALCVPCHRAKTRRESAERAELRSPQIRLFQIAEAIA